MRTIVVMGLGNPGRGYSRTRHNVGFRCVDRYAEHCGVRFARTACHARLAEAQLESARVILAKPRTFMNLSGRSAQALVHSLGISPADLVVVHDDIDLPLGRLRVRSSGGPGGHNGIKSILSALHTDRFPRVRVGVSRPGGMEDPEWREDSLVDYVLSPFGAEEEPVIEAAVARVSEVLDCIVREGVDAAMNRFNSVV